MTRRTSSLIERSAFSEDAARASRVSPALPRLALSPDEASAAIGCSRTFFDEQVSPELRWVRRGRRKFVSVRELERWLEESAALTLGTR
jgi:hypothetical protein